MLTDISRGTVLHRWFDTTRPPKNKFFVIIGEDDDNIIGFFFVNSKINDFIKKRPELFDMQMPVKASDYTFLKYDSFIAAHALSKMKKETLCAEVKKGETIIKGRLTDQDITLLLNAVRNSKLFSPAERNRFFI